MFSDQGTHALIGAAEANGIEPAALCTGNPSTISYPETKEETDMIGYALGCLTVGAVWFFWPKLRAWAFGGQAKLVRGVKAEEAKLEEKL